MEPQLQLVHWYDIERHRIACGAMGQSNSTKHVRGVSCSACLDIASAGRAAIHAQQDVSRADP